MATKFARVLLMCLLLSIACTVQAKKISIYERTDEFKGNTIYFTDNEQTKLEGGSFVSMRYVFLSFMALSPITDASLAYTIKVDASLPGWMFISDGESLVLKVDDEVVSLSGSGSISGREVTSMGVKEVAYYSFPLSTLRRLASAKSIQFRLYGEKGQITGTFSERLMETIRFFGQQAPELIKDPGGTGAITPAEPAMPATPSPEETGAPPT